MTGSWISERRLLSSVPGIGVRWVAGWQPATVGPSLPYAGYVYLGMTTLPLAIVGLLAGAEPWRIRLFILTAVFSVVVPLMAFSPYFRPALILFYPLRAAAHYGDVTFRAGTFFLWITAARLGLDALICRRDRTLLILTLGLLGGIVVASAAAFIAIYPSGAVSGYSSWLGVPNPQLFCAHRHVRFHRTLAVDDDRSTRREIPMDGCLSRSCVF